MSGGDKSVVDEAMFGYRPYNPYRPSRLDIIKARLRGQLVTVTVTPEDLARGIPGDPHNCPGAIAASRALNLPRGHLVIDHGGFTDYGTEPWKKGTVYKHWTPVDAERWSTMLSAIDHSARAPIPAAQLAAKPFVFVKR